MKLIVYSLIVSKYFVCMHLTYIVPCTGDSISKSTYIVCFVYSYTGSSTAISLYTEVVNMQELVNHEYKKYYAV